MALSATRAVVGALNRGAYVFERSAGNGFTQIQKFQSDAPDSNDRYAWRVNLTDSFIAVGAVADSDNGAESGSGYIIELDGPLCDGGGAGICLDGADGLLCDERPDCGDDVVQDAEACDDGNPVNGDGCSDQCQVELMSQLPRYPRQKSRIAGWRIHDRPGR